MQMSVRERILTIRLMDKANANPAHAEVFGIVVVSRPPEPRLQAVLNSEKHTS